MCAASRSSAALRDRLPPFTFRTTTSQGRIVAVAGNVGQNTVNNPATAWVTVPNGNSVVVRGTVSLAAVDNSRYIYYAEFKSNRSPDCALISFRVTYTVTEVE